MRWIAPLLVFLVAASRGDEVREIAFASCFKETLPAPALDALVGLAPDVFVWMGDNVYGDTEDMALLREKYGKVLAMPTYQNLAEQSQVIGTWDDHDYGANDAGREFGPKAESQQVFLDFLGVAPDSPRREREGVYAVHDFGEPGRRVRVILLDTRYFRDQPGSDGTILGEAQWEWLERTLRESEAEVNLLVSSIQVLPTLHPWEKWSNFPSQRKRLLALLAEPELPPVLLLSGDRHLAEISRTDAPGYPLFEITSSSLNRPLGGSDDELNGMRVGRNFRPSNFGTLSIDWSRSPAVLTACIRDERGRPQRAVSFELQR